MHAGNSRCDGGGRRLASAGPAPPGASDLDLLRLSYVCGADALLEGRPERSWVLSKIHRFFDDSPDPASAQTISISALVEEVRRHCGS